MKYELSDQEKQLLSCIDTFKQNKAADKDPQQPAIIRKKELESYLEGIAKQFRIQYQRSSTPMNSNYIFSLEKHEAQVKIYYRYRHFYTRHEVIIKPL
ncbi:hypothetical protein WQ57_15325 [Mesobacillus campisalis]|uniref:Uncharacterized protein n=1 Tax=Mesobacillus campisalis TaxID=1408103 RepID=A0A0M2SVW1_9BACI|nr:hypothetical protein [Mesobacillus campisalis]KKK37102.1 hypothetical protein WQ57_15325 [Mesobacillus campisalis]